MPSLVPAKAPVTAIIRTREPTVFSDLSPIRELTPIDEPTVEQLLESEDDIEDAIYQDEMVATKKQKLSVRTATCCGII